MYSKTPFLLSAMLLLAMPARAWETAWEASFAPTITSDYDFRGISLSAREPAIQMAFDVAAANGFSAAIWTSNVDFGVPDVDVEIDYTLGWSGEAGGLDLNTGLAYYSYPHGSDLNYPEYWFGLGKSFSDRFSLDGKLWYSSDYAGVGEAATYLETSATFRLPAGVGLTLQAGRSSGDYWDSVNCEGYSDYSVRLRKSVARWDRGLSLIDGSDLPSAPDSDVNSTERKAVLSVATTLPRR